MQFIFVTASLISMTCALTIRSPQQFQGVLKACNPMNPYACPGGQICVARICSRQLTFGGCAFACSSVGTEIPASVSGSQGSWSGSAVPSNVVAKPTDNTWNANMPMENTSSDGIPWVIDGSNADTPPAPQLLSPAVLVDNTQSATAALPAAQLLNPAMPVDDTLPTIAIPLETPAPQGLDPAIPVDDSLPTMAIPLKVRRSQKRRWR